MSIISTTIYLYNKYNNYCMYRIVSKKKCIQIFGKNFKQIFIIFELEQNNKIDFCRKLFY